MKSLILDTSHEISYLVLAENSEIIFFKKFEKKSLSRELFQSIDSILKETNTEISGLKYIAAGIGPGSFTGLRVGAMICKTINFAKKIPIIGYVSLQAYTPMASGSFLSVFDAKSDGIYALEAKYAKNKISYESNPKLLSADEAKKKFDSAGAIISPDQDVLKEKFKNYKNKFINGFFDPFRVLCIADNLYKNKSFIDFQTFNLLYLRGPNHIEQ